MDARWAYAFFAAGLVLFLATVLVILWRSGPNGPAGSPTSGLWTWLEGKKTVLIVLAVIILRYVDRRGWIDAQLFTDLQDLLVGGGALTYLSKMSRMEKKQDAVKDDTAVVLATMPVGPLTPRRVEAPAEPPIPPAKAIKDSS